MRNPMNSNGRNAVPGTMLLLALAVAQPAQAALVSRWELNNNTTLSILPSQPPEGVGGPARLVLQGQDSPVGVGREIDGGSITCLP